MSAMANKYKTWICILLAVMVPLLFPVRAHAERPASGAGLKGNLAAESTKIDRSSYVDGSAYANPAPAVDTVRIGLNYEDSAVEEAAFINTSGQGFYIGVFDEERIFTELARTEESRVSITSTANGRRWHILLDGEYALEEKAKNAAASYGGFAQEIEGKYRALYGSFDSMQAAEAVRDKYRLPGVAYAPGQVELRVVTPTDRQELFTPAEGQLALAVLPMGDGPTRYNEEVYRGGFECLLLESGMLTVINYVGLEDYVKGVIPYEMNYNWPYEALRAQAVCARTYVVYNQNEYEDQGFDITADTYSQVYRGLLEANETTDLAVASTAGQYVRYEGEICQIYYSAADGGATEDGLNVFDADRPYLIGKPDPFEDAIDFSLKAWSIRRSSDNISSRLKWDEYELGPIKELRPEYSDTGNVIAMTFVDKDNASLRIEGRRCYTILGLNSPHFTVETDNNGFTFNGGGLGHSCGMSQWGAYAMAYVYGYNYEDILRFYFTGAYIA